MSKYQQGTRLEYEARDILVGRGFIVIRSAGSKGPVDLVAIGSQEILLVQVSKLKVKSSRDLEDLRSMQAPPNVRRQLWERAPFGSWTITDIERAP